MLPPGTAAVGSGLAVLGAASYVHLAVAGHTLDPARMSSVAVLWSIVFAIGPGLFFPVEQEITRIVAGRRVHRDGAGPVLRRGALLAAAMLAALLVVLLAGAEPLARRLFDGDTGMVWTLAGAFVGLALAHTTRGILAGTGAFGWYGAQLGIDGALRMGMAVALGVSGVDSALWFSLVLVVAPIASVLFTVPAVLNRARPGSSVVWLDLCRGLGLLTVTALLSQLLVNIAVVDVRLLAPGEVAVAAALLSALVLVRVPLFLFASVQASLLSGVSSAVAARDRATYRRLLTRTLAVVTALGTAGAVVAVIAGPWLSVRLFDAPNVLGRADFAWLGLGTLAYLWAMVLGQGVLALGCHRDQALAWVLGIVVLAVLTLVPGDVVVRVELGYAVGAVAVAAALAVVLARAAARPWPGAGQSAPVAVGDRP